jgi:hypothetical protein
MNNTVAALKRIRFVEFWFEVMRTYGLHFGCPPGLVGQGVEVGSDGAGVGGSGVGVQPGVLGL